MAVITMREAISQALWEEMERDERVFILGEEVGVWGGTYAVTKGFFDRFGPERVRDTPIAEAAIIEEVARENNATTLRVAADGAERAKLWLGRKSAFGAVAQAAPDYYLHDTVVPRTKLVETMTRVYEIADRHGIMMLNVFHAGDGNLHPLMAFDSAEEGMLDRVKAAARELVEVCVAVGGSLSGEHGIGIEKRELMTLVFSEADLDAQARVRESFDPDAVFNPDKVLPAGSRCFDLGRPPLEGMWV